MKNSILFLAVASVFALASCGEKAPESTGVDSVSAVVDTTVVVDTVKADTTAAADTTKK